MINIVSNLFENDNYEKLELEDGILFFKENDVKKDFWFVVEESDLNLIEEKQSEILKNCISNFNSIDLNKNISMLIIWNTGGELAFKEMKKILMQVEENPYYFKKHVLYYSPSELEQLDYEISDSSINEFFLSKITNEENFKLYKENPMQGSWRELFYRIIIKLPFMHVNIDTTTNIESLQQAIEDKLESNSDNIIKNLNDKVFELYSDIENDEIKEINVTSVVDELLVVLEEGASNGN